MWQCSADVAVEMAATQSHAFTIIVPIDLTLLFTGYGPLPAVVGTQHQTGAWDAANQTRTVLLSDGSHAREHLTQYDSSQYFAYTVSGFTGVLRWLASEAHGEWWFVAVGPARTQVRWRYTFVPNARIVAPLMWVITRFAWWGYMRKALQLAQEHVERNNSARTP